MLFKWKYLFKWKKFPERKVFLFNFSNFLVFDKMLPRYKESIKRNTSIDDTKNNETTLTHHILNRTQSSYKTERKK